MLAASEDVPSAAPRANNCVRFIDEENQIIAFFNFIDDSLDALFKHTAQHRPRHETTHL